MLKQYHNVLGKEVIEYEVFAYHYHKDLKKCFDESLMFETQEEAEKKANELNEMV